LSSTNTAIEDANKAISEVNITNSLTIPVGFSQLRVYKMGNAYSFHLPFADIALASGVDYTIVSGIPVETRPLASIGINYIAHEITGTPRIAMTFFSDGRITMTPKGAVPAEGRIRLYQVVL